MFCTNCGKEINIDKQFCPYCGLKVEKSNTEENNKPTPKISLTLGFVSLCLLLMSFHIIIDIIAIAVAISSICFYFIKEKENRYGKWVLCLDIVSIISHILWIIFILFWI